MRHVGDGIGLDEIIATGVAPTNDLESAIVATLPPGAYTAILSGKNNTSGVALIELYDLNSATTDSKLDNISTRAFVDVGSNVVIAGFILGGDSANDNVVLRGIGPSLPVSNPLADPTLELHNSGGALLASNDNCGASSLPPPDPLEPCIDISLAPGPARNRFRQPAHAEEQQEDPDRELKPSYVEAEAEQAPARNGHGGKAHVASWSALGALSRTSIDVSASSDVVRFGVRM